MDKEEIIKELYGYLDRYYSDVAIVDGDVLFNDEDGNSWAISVSAV